MADANMTHARALDVARECKVIADHACALLGKIDRFLAFNSDQAIDWGNETKPTFLTEDADGNLDGLLFSRQNLSNSIFSLEQIQRLLTNQTITQGDHLGNLNKLAQAAPQLR